MFHRFVYMLVLLLWPMPELVAADVVVRPEEQSGPLDNPLKGWCPYTNAGEIHQPYSMVFQYVSWRELEPVEGEYRFAEWERTWDVPEAQGKHIIFRVYVDYPSLPSGMPEWLRSAGIRETPYKDHGGGRSPDYDDPRLLAAMERFLTALGGRYNDHPRIAFIQLGMLGHWGEWHTWPKENLYASPQTEERIIRAYRQAFPDKSLMVRYSRDYAGEQAWLGFHDDMFPQDTDNGKDWSFLAGLRQTKRMQNWQVAVVGGEMVPNQARQWLGKDYETTLTMLDRAHFTWVGPYCPALERSNDASFTTRSEALIRRMGYEYQLTELRHPREFLSGQPFSLELSGKNRGVAPFYYPWHVKWALIDSAGSVVASQSTEWDIRRWQPGNFNESAQLSFDVPAGVYRLAVGIHDPWLLRPTIRFANKGDVVEGWTVLSELVSTTP